MTGEVIEIKETRESREVEGKTIIKNGLVVVKIREKRMNLKKGLRNKQQRSQKIQSNILRTMKSPPKGIYADI
jgi:hypothetical protein